MDFKGFYDEIIFDVDRSILKSYTGKQGDTKSRGLYVTVTQKNAVIDDLTGLSMRLFYEKPDKTRGFIDGVVDGNKFRIDYTNQMYAVPGVVKAELRLMGVDGEIITAKTFKILVDSSIADGSIVSENERGILDRAFELAEDIIPRLELLDVELLEDVQDEMLGARHSETKDVTYDSLGQRLDAAEQDLLDHKAEYTSNRQQDQLKIAKVEKELNDYKATMQQININQEPKQKATGYGAISLPPNAAEGQVSTRLEGLTTTNLIKNGNFRDGELGWELVSPSDIFRITDRIIAKGTLTQSGSSGCYQDVSGNINDIYYIGFDYKYISDDDIDVTIRDYGTMDNPTKIELDNQSGYKSIVIPGRLNGIRVYFRTLKGFSYNSEVDNIRVINLTQTFGEGNEPTKEECDKIFANWFDGTKSTISASRLKSVGKNLFDGKLERGVYSTQNGEKVSHFARIRSVNKIKVSPNSSYRITNISDNGSIYIFCYDQNGKFVEYLGYTLRSGNFVMSDTTHFITFHSLSEDLNTLVQIEQGTTATPYEPYRESNAYVVAADKDTGEILELRSLPNGTKDEINVTDRKLIKRIGEKSNIANGMVIDFADMAEGGTYYAWNDDGETETGVKGDTLGIDATTLTYQLAEPVEIPIQVSGSIASYPSGTIYIEPVTTAAGIYSGGIEVTYEQLGIKELETISKIDYMTGIETFLDVSKTVISEDGKSFTHPDLEDGDIVFFEYIHNLESTTGETEVEYYDSRFVFKDRTTGKFYKVVYFVDNGVLDYELVEV